MKALCNVEIIKNLCVLWIEYVLTCLAKKKEKKKKSMFWLPTVNTEILRSRGEIILLKVSKIIIFVCFLIKCVSCCKICVVYSKVKFITNITNVTGIHTFYFYNNKHTFITTNIIFTTKHTYFIKLAFTHF